MNDLPYLRGYPESLRAQARELLTLGKLSGFLQARYPATHTVRSDKALYDYVIALKNEAMRAAPAIHKVTYDSRLQVEGEIIQSNLQAMKAQGIEPAWMKEKAQQLLESQERSDRLAAICSSDYPLKDEVEAQNWARERYVRQLSLSPCLKEQMEKIIAESEVSGKWPSMGIHI